MKPNLLIIAGELSSDKYAAELVPEIRDQYPGMKIIGIGGLELKTVADEFMEEIASTNTVGLIEQLSRSAVKRAISKLKKRLRSTAFHGAVIVDCAHINNRFSAILAQHNIPITSYITPNFWIWNDQQNMARLASYSHTIITVSPAERDAFTPLHQNVHYFGHPLVDKLSKERPTVPSAATAPQSPAIIAGFIGSRKQEVNNLLPTFGKVAQVLANTHNIPFYLAPIPPHIAPYVKRQLKKWPHITQWQDTKDQLLNAATVALTGAGTTTLELVVRNMPQVILGRIHPIGAFLGHLFVPQGIENIGLPNIFSGKRIVPEFMQNLPPKTIATTLAKLAQSDGQRQKIKADYADLLSQLIPNTKQTPILQAIASKIALRG